MVSNFSPSKFIMGFDYGTKYIGVAIGQRTTNHASPLECLEIKHKKIDWIAIENLIKLWQPQALIIGVPYTTLKEPQEITIQCLKFSKKLQNKFKLPTYEVDEILSTWEAKKHLIMQYKDKLTIKEIKKINSYAAVIILEQWLNENK